MAKNGKTGKKKGKYDHWPKKVKLEEALNAFEKFRNMCQFQMEVGYWATVDFPTKHHINKLLSIQYMDRQLLEMVYGKGLVNRVFQMIPYCKSYIAFVRDTKESDDDQRRESGGGSIKTSSTN